MKKLTVSLICLSLLLMLTACAKSSQIRDCTLEEFHAARGKPDTVILDVRKASTMQDDLKFIEGAVHLPLNILATNLEKVRKDANIYILSNDPKTTVKAANILADNGYGFIYRVAEGFNAYAARYPLN
ncbi:MAG TPA: rhodanese-like domain-containing protein [bacterium]|nr:rhodanese-like domain-containing protein [bacterium]